MVVPGSKVGSYTLLAELGAGEGPVDVLNVKGRT